MLVWIIFIPFVVMPMVDALIPNDHYYTLYLNEKEGVAPNTEWAQKYQAKFDQLGVVNFSTAVAHILHSLTVEDAMTSFGIKLPIENGIPAMNPDITADDSDALIANIPSRPNQFLSPGMNGFVNFMDDVTKPGWEKRGPKLTRMLHVYHMQEMWALSRKAANDFFGVSEDICIGALDHVNNGITLAIPFIFDWFKNKLPQWPNTTLPAFPDIPLTMDDNGESWMIWKAGLSTDNLKRGKVKSMGLYTHCLMRKFPRTEQPIGVDICCAVKTVGDYSYTKVSTGEVPTQCLNNCIYTRDDKPGSNYCFATGEQVVHCGNKNGNCLAVLDNITGKCVFTSDNCIKPAEAFVIPSDGCDNCKCVIP